MAAEGPARDRSGGPEAARPAPGQPLPERPEATPGGGYRLVVFVLGEQRFGLRLDAVEQVVRLVAIMPLPEAPDIVQGVIDLRGRIVPVVDIRTRFRLPERTPRLSDHLIVARTARRSVALLVEAVEGVVESPDAAVTAAAEILPGLAYLEGVIRLADGAIFIHDLDTFLSLEEERALDAALRTGAEAGDAA
jgi:purine-binding chemotaxis protein CheW